MDTLKIKAFLLAEKYKSFSRAAEEFSYTPSAFSHIADSLEQELGIKLFNRTRRGVELTQAGKELYDKFVAVVNAERELVEAASVLSDGKKNELRIGSYSSIALHILPGILQDFKELYPSVKTSILVDDVMQGWLDNNTADVILSEKPFERNVKWYPIMEDEYVVAAHKSIFPNREKICKEELYGHTFIRTGEEALNSYLDYSSFKETITLKSIENDSVISMIKENIGLSVLPALTMKNCPEEVKVLKLEPKLSRTVGIAFKTGKLPWSAEQFIRHVKKNFSEK